MDTVLEKVTWFKDNLVWGWPMVILILGAGVLLSIRTKFLQARKFKYSLDSTIVSTVKDIGKQKGKEAKKEKNDNSISQFEAFSAAISGTVGTGNIIGVTSAILTGGPGAVFWMWLSAFFGMVTNYSENVLGLYFRKKEKNGDLSGGPMYYLSEGMPWKKFGKVLGYLAAIFCVFAAIGMSGNQTNKISATVTGAFFGDANAQTKKVVALIVGIVVAVVLALVIIGGIKRIGKVASILVPFMSLVFIGMALIIIIVNGNRIGHAFSMIFSNIFTFRGVLGGVSGYAFSQIIQKGLARGVFSNEAGLGSSVIAHSASETREPVKQGLWGVFEVFFDTFIICTFTALLILVSYDDVTLFTYCKGIGDTATSMGAFTGTFGTFGTVVFSIIMPLFAFTTILAWSYYGEKSTEFLFARFGDKAKRISTFVFKVVYVLLVVVAAVINGELAWAISDTANGLMALPNLIGLIFMSGLVAKITKNYFDRKKGKKVAPMLSAYPEMNEAFARELENASEEEKISLS